MIRPLRARHRLVFAALALLLPAAWVAALWARAPEPVEPVATGEPLAGRAAAESGAPAGEPPAETGR